MKIFVAGATGFVGKEIIRYAHSKGHTLKCLVRKGSENKLPKPDQKIELVFGDVNSPQTFQGQLNDCEAVIYLVGIIREFPSKEVICEKLHYEGAKNLIDEAKKSEVKHFVLMSANGARLDGITNYQITKARAEEYLKNSGLNYTIFRPSLIFGNPEGNGRPEFFSELAQNFFGGLLTSPPFLPNFNGGKSIKMSPIAVEDVAKGFVDALENKKAKDKIYFLGSETKTWSEILDLLCEAIGKKKLKLPVPIILMKIPAFFMQKFEFGPLALDQLLMLEEGNVCDGSEFYRDFGFQTKKLTVQAISYIKNYRA